MNLLRKLLVLGFSLFLVSEVLGDYGTFALYNDTRFSTVYVEKLDDDGEIRKWTLDYEECIRVPNEYVDDIKIHYDAFPFFSRGLIKMKGVPQKVLCSFGECRSNDWRLSSALDKVSDYFLKPDIYGKRWKCKFRM